MSAEDFETKEKAIGFIKEKLIDGEYRIVKTPDGMFWLTRNREGVIDQDSVLGISRKEAIEIAAQQTARHIGYDWAFDLNIQQGHQNPDFNQARKAGFSFGATEMSVEFLELEEIQAVEVIEQVSTVSLRALRWALLTHSIIWVL